MWFFNLSFLSPITISVTFIRQNDLGGNEYICSLVSRGEKGVLRSQKGRCGESGEEEKQQKSSSRTAVDGSRSHGFLPMDLWERGHLWSRSKYSPGNHWCVPSTFSTPGQECDGCAWPVVPVTASHPWWMKSGLGIETEAGGRSTHILLL